MAIDLTRLTQSDLLTIVNSAPLGAVLTRARLRRQMDAGALRFGDGTHVHLVKYVRWLVQEVEKPRTPKADYFEAKRKQAQRNRAATKAAQDIFPIPEIVDCERRKAAGESFRLFCTTYFPGAFWRPWSQDHLRVIAKIERAVREGGLFAFAMPRGSGKTALARCAAVWAILYGYRPFVCMIAGSQDNARELLRPIRTFILEEPLLLEDFPEAVYPLRCLENSSKRQLQQHIEGKLTHVHWGQDKMVFPSIEGEHLPQALRDDGIEVSPSAGSIITTTSLDSNLRGQQHTRPDRSIIRPSLVLLDDPQTRESAMSADQTRKRLNLVHGDVMGLAGPGESISALLTCTVMYEGDLADTLLDREKSPEWDSERTKLVYAWPADNALWDKYADIKRTKGKEAATAFYVSHRGPMDRGASVAWPDRFDAKAGEISAIQHAFNLRLRTSPDGFATEYQNEPALVQTADNVLTVDQVLAKVSGHKRGDVPAACTKLTMFIDIHDPLLYFMVCGWGEDFGGHIVEYGTLPKQNRSFFTKNDASHTLAAMFPGHGVEGAIHAGLEKLVTEYLGKEWSRGGALMRLDRLLVDSGYKPGVVADVKRRCGGSVMMLSKGVGIRATRRPFAAYTKRPGETIGDHWYSNKADTYGLMLTIDRRDIINDDLGAVTTVPRKLGRGSGLKINDVFWSVFLNNAAFFTTGAKNYLTGADTALSIDGLTKAEVAFLDQTDGDGKPIGVMPAILLVPTALSAIGTMLFKSLEIRDTTANTKFPVANPHQNKFRVEVSRYLSNGQYTGNSSKAWYLLADPTDLPVIEVAFLNGQESPTIETAEADFNVLGIQMRGYHDFGCALQDQRGGVKSKGEAA